MKTKMSTSLVCTFAVLSIWYAVMCSAGPSYQVGNTVGNDEMGNAFNGNTFTWGPTECHLYGRAFAPPRNEAARAAFFGIVSTLWIGIEYNASGDSPKYYVVGGRFTGCLYDGYPFGDSSSWWKGGIINQTEGSVQLDGGRQLITVPEATALSSVGCVASKCNNNDDCFGNGLSVSGDWPNCTCGGCVTGATGDMCNIFSIGAQNFTIHPNITYGTMGSMRAICEASDRYLFTHTTNQSHWDLLQSFIPSSFRFYLDLTDDMNTSRWTSSNTTISVGSIFVDTLYGEWAPGEGDNITGGRCVDMVGGRLYQSSCSGNRFVMCVDGPKFPTATVLKLNSATFSIPVTSLTESPTDPPTPTLDTLAPSNRSTQTRTDSIKDAPLGNTVSTPTATDTGTPSIMSSRSVEATPTCDGHVTSNISTPCDILIGTPDCEPIIFTFTYSMWKDKSEFTSYPQRLQSALVSYEDSRLRSNFTERIPSSPNVSLSPSTRAFSFGIQSSNLRILRRTTLEASSVPSTRGIHVQVWVVQDDAQLIGGRGKLSFLSFAYTGDTSLTGGLYSVEFPADELFGGGCKLPFNVRVILDLQDAPQSTHSKAVDDVAITLVSVGAVVTAMPYSIVKAGMVSSLRDMLRCNVVDPYEDISGINNPLSIAVGSSYGSYMRGSILSGTVVLGTAIFLVAIVYSMMYIFGGDITLIKGQPRWLALVGKLSLPSALTIPIVVSAEMCISSAVSLITMPHTTPGDVVVGLIPLLGMIAFCLHVGMVVSLNPPVVIVSTESVPLHTNGKHGDHNNDVELLNISDEDSQSEISDTNRPSNSTDTQRPLRPLPRLVKYLLEPTHAIAPPPTTAPNNSDSIERIAKWVAYYSIYATETTWLPFRAVEVSVGTLLNIMEGAVVEGRESCIARSILSLLITLFLIAVILIKRPYAVVIQLWSSMVCAVLMLISATIIFANLWVADDGVEGVASIILDVASIIIALQSIIDVVMFLLLLAPFFREILDMRSKTRKSEVEHILHYQCDTEIDDRDVIPLQIIHEEDDLERPHSGLALDSTAAASVATRKGSDALVMANSDTATKSSERSAHSSESDGDLSKGPHPNKKEKTKKICRSKAQRYAEQATTSHPKTTKPRTVDEAIIQELEDTRRRQTAALQFKHAQIELSDSE